MRGKISDLLKQFNLEHGLTMLKQHPDDLG